MSTAEAIDAWWQRDGALERQFFTAQRSRFRDRIGKLLGKNQPPTFNGYRNHLLAGHAVGALPVDGAAKLPLDCLATQNFDMIANAQANGPLQFLTPVARDAVLKNLMDLEAGKTPLTAQAENAVVLRFHARR